MVKHYPRFAFCIILSFIFLKLAAQPAGDKKLFTLLPSSSTGVNFRNDLNEDNKMFYYLYEYLYNGAGVSFGDFNNDGLQDIYFTSTLGPNKLFLNEGNFHFKDITLSAGVDGGPGIKTGVNVIDINNDGYMDILICKGGPVSGNPADRKKVLYINNHDLTFTNKAAEYGLDDESYTTQAYFFDYDKDGDMDVLFVNHPYDFNSTMLIQAKMVNGKAVFADDTTTVNVSNRLFENRGGKFVDVTKKAGLLTYAFGLSASIFDFNGDGYPDIYVANDFNKPDYLFINNKNGTFTDKLSDYFGHISFFAMGTDVNDINNDGYEDLYTLDMATKDPVRQKQLFALNVNYDKFQLLPRFGLFYQYTHNTLQLNNGNGTFSEMAFHAGVAQTDWSWAGLIADYDNDGWKDIYVTNGIKRDITDWDYKVFVLDSIKNLVAKGLPVDLNNWFRQIPTNKIKNFFFHNNGSLHFDNYTDVWADVPPSISNGAAYADLDNDGDLDLVVNNMDDEAFVYKNNTSELGNAHYLRFKFFKSRTSPAEVYGTAVKLTDAEGKIQVQHYDPQRGFESTMEHIMHFGTGPLSSMAKVEVTFPSGKKIMLSDVKTNQVLTLFESDATIPPVVNEIKKPAIFKDISKQNIFNYTHVENDFIDFKREPLIPYKCSRKGPYYAIADVNGDKRPDIFIGGAAGEDGKLMLQTADGKFIESKQQVFAKDKNYEDDGVLFFDADGDGDMDLYVVSGGAEFDAGSPMYQDRLYLNDGKGNFTRAMNALPNETFNGSCVIPLDFNGDGDMDLFIGGGVMPGKFPQHDKCMLLQNNKGVFTDVTEKIAPELNNVGIVNDAVWADVDGDKKNELILAGEWMPVTIFKLQNGVFKKIDPDVNIKTATVPVKDSTVKLDAITGWWNTIKAEDINGDGYIDLIVGNRGTNSKITCDINHPTTIYAKDFDNNGSYDAVLGYYNEGKCYPMFSRDQLIDQMPMFRKKYIRYKQYAGQTMDDLFTAEQKKGMQVFTASCFESGVLINNGDGSFHFEPFPERAQLSTINDMVIDDFDKDGIKDILVCGNSTDPDVATGNYDATAALLMKGDGKGHFTAVPFTDAGLKVKGEVRRIAYLKQKQNPLLLLLKNNAAAQVLSTQ